MQPHACAGRTSSAAPRYGYGPEAVTLISTPLYSNTTLVVFLPALALGGTVVLMARFEAGRYLELAGSTARRTRCSCPCNTSASWRATDFARFDLSSFRVKFSTSAPFAAALKGDVLTRWPGGLIEFYG